jgi:hypothetical protein
VLEGS